MTGPYSGRLTSEFETWSGHQAARSSDKPASKARLAGINTRARHLPIIFLYDNVNRILRVMWWRWVAVGFTAVAILLAPAGPAYADDGDGNTNPCTDIDYAKTHTDECQFFAPDPTPVNPFLLGGGGHSNGGGLLGLIHHLTGLL